MKANGQGSFQHDKGRAREATKAGECQLKASRTMLPLTALFWVPLASGEHVVGQWCSWLVMRSWDPCTGCTARWKQNFEVQRASKRAELTAFLCLLERLIGPIKVLLVDNQGITDGLWRGRNCIRPRAGDADVWIKIWEEMHCLAARDIVEVEHVKAHRTKKEKKDMSHFEMFVAEGNEESG